MFPKPVTMLLLTCFVHASVIPGSAHGADRTDIAVSVLEFGGAVGNLMWVSIKNTEKVSDKEAGRYGQVAHDIRAQIELGRASSKAVKANFDIIGTTLTYVAVTDPEPLSKGVAAAAAWAAKKTGDAMGQLVIEQSEKQALHLLAQGLKNSGLSETQLSGMTAEELRAKVKDLRVGGQELGKIAQDIPGGLQMLEAHAVDVATDIGVLAISKAEGVATTAAQIKAELKTTKDNLDAYQKEVETHLKFIETRLGGLEHATQLVGEKLSALDREVQGQARALRAMAQVSYSGWSTSQKLQAVQAGLFPDLNASQQAALVDSLKAEQAREEMVGGIQRAAQDFGNLAAIAGNIGLPSDVVKGLQGAQIAATGIAQFATGNYLGAVTSLTSIAGLGAPDAAAQRHAQMIKFLEEQFAAVHQKLDKIIDLQVQTLKAVAALAEEQRSFRREVLGQLDQIELTVLRSEQILRAILLSKWTECRGLINGTVLNGQFSITSKEQLAGVIDNPHTAVYAGQCYATLVGFLDAWVKPAEWSGQIIAAGNFPTDAIASEPDLQRGWQAFQSQRINAYVTARDFILDALPGAANAPAEALARFAQPVVDARYSFDLQKAVGLATGLSTFKCDQNDILADGLRDLICFGLVEGAAKSPRTGRWRDILSAALIGPHANRLIDTGITLSTVSDFALRTSSGVFDLVPRSAIDNFSTEGSPPALRSALAQGKGHEILKKLRWLTESMVLQQSIAYGDYTASLIVDALYDPAIRALNINAATMTGLQHKAVTAMKANPILARNVVMLAMRRAREDALGGRDKAEAAMYNRSYYGLALNDFSGARACSQSPQPRQRLAELFPNWKFDYRATAAERQESSLRACPPAIESDPNVDAQRIALGSGPTVTFGPDFYVALPSPPGLTSGLYEQPDSLRIALAYRDRVSQALIDRGLSETIRRSVGAGAGWTPEAKSVAFALVNEGWSWSHREKSAP